MLIITEWLGHSCVACEIHGWNLTNCQHCEVDHPPGSDNHWVVDRYCVDKIPPIISSIIFLFLQLYDIIVFTICKWHVAFILLKNTYIPVRQDH